MAILNYTTKIKPEKTASEIQEKLAKAGAQAILTEYDEGLMCAMSFRIMSQHGMLSFRLPINIQGVLNAIQHDNKIPKKFKTKEQATRIAWRILKDWIEAQLAIVEAQMANIIEVFLPYVQNQTGQTLFETLESNGYRQLVA